MRNLTNKTVMQNVNPPTCAGENLNVTALANNRLSGYGYDAGNITHDATTGNNYSYHAENRITGAAGSTYTVACPELLGEGMPMGTVSRNRAAQQVQFTGTWPYRGRCRTKKIQPVNMEHRWRGIEISGQPSLPRHSVRQQHSQ